MKSSEFLNIDIDIHSKSGLTELIKALGSSKTDGFTLATLKIASISLVAMRFAAVFFFIGFFLIIGTHTVYAKSPTPISEKEKAELITIGEAKDFFIWPKDTGEFLTLDVKGRTYIFDDDNIKAGVQDAIRQLLKRDFPATNIYLQSPSENDIAQKTSVFLTYSLGYKVGKVDSKDILIAYINFSPALNCVNCDTILKEKSNTFFNKALDFPFIFILSDDLENDFQKLANQTPAGYDERLFSEMHQVTFDADLISNEISDDFKVLSSFLIKAQNTKKYYDLKKDKD